MPHIAQATLESLAPYSQSRFHNTPKIEKESSDAYDKRTWQGHLHTNEEGHIVIPPTAFMRCVQDGAKYLSMPVPGKGKATYTKNFNSGVLVLEPLVLPIKARDCEFEDLFLNADGLRGSGKRVMRRMPVIHKWSGTVSFHVTDDTITEDVFLYTLEQSGQFRGIGRFRPQNGGFYGRFKVSKLVWE